MRCVGEGWRYADADAMLAREACHGGAHTMYSQEAVLGPLGLAAKTVRTANVL